MNIRNDQLNAEIEKPKQDISSVSFETVLSNAISMKATSNRSIFSFGKLNWFITNLKPI